MSTSLIIPKNPLYPPSMDWQLLRREGIRHIENLASDIWTDYNLHDPGITILEILCYAITDLGYRSNMSPADLFATPNNDSFYTAAKILPCAPVTALDLRKVLIDIPGVQNAWVQQMDEAEVRFHWPEGLVNTYALTVLEPYIKMATGEVGLPAIENIDTELLLTINGCVSDKEKQAAREKFHEELLAGLQAGGIMAELKKVLLLYVIDKYYQEALFFLETYLIEADPDLNAEEDIASLIRWLPVMQQEMGDFNGWDQLIALVDNYPALQTFFYYDPILCLYFTGSLRIGELPEKDEPPAYNLFVPQGIYSVTLRLEEGHVGEEADIMAEAKRRLHRVRNLSEDIHPDVHIAETVGMGLDLALELDPTTDKWEVLANVYRAIAHYLSPDIRFYSLEEMMNHYAQFEINSEVLEVLQTSQVPAPLTTALESLLDKRITGDVAFKAAVAVVWDAVAMEDYYSDVFIQSKKYYNADPVYKGPLLQHGFIDEAELLLAQPRQTVYRSDLYQIIAAVAGVQQIERLDMYLCKDRDENFRVEKWCIAFDCKCLPALSIDCSTFAVISHYKEVPVDMLRLKEYLDVHPDTTTKINREQQQDLPVPNGRVLTDLTEFTSVQEDFPRTYKIGNTGISKKQPELRQAQAKQLKGYLFFYDQLLANYLTQLSSVKTFLSVKGDDAGMYQALYNIPGIRELLLDYKGAQVVPSTLNKIDPNPEWEVFKADDHNAYIAALKSLTEGSYTNKQLYHNRLLDHMLARFGEQFTDYALQLYRIEMPLSDCDAWAVDEGLKESIADKQRFLQQVPALGAKRGSGFIYQFEKDEFRYWKTDNVEGVRKRVCAILGMQDASRHTITCEPVFEVGVGETDNLGSPTVETEYVFYVRAQGQGAPRLLVSTERFRSFDQAKKARLDFLNRAGDSSAYDIVEENIVGFWLNIPTGSRTIKNALLLEPSPGRDGAAKRLEYIRGLASGNCNDDSFHLLEHILLRPRNNTFTKLLTPMICCPEDLALLDPYSFWITIVLPDWAERFKNCDRREVFMQTLRREMPAHLPVRYVMLSRADMLAFEAAYNEWIKRLCTKQQPGLAEANDVLVTLMNNWKENQIHYF
jgi:hypothetical protein